VTLAERVLAQSVKARALELGFDRVAIGPAAIAHGEAFERWLDAGRAGTMDYLEATRAERLDPARLLPGCRSVVAVALNYARGADEPEWRGVARYARGADYHNVMRPRLHVLRDFVSAAAGAESRASLDTSAVLERDLAAAAGLGWIGKNTNLIAPGLGSYFLIGLVLTTAVLPADDAVPDHCGTCTACLEACPTAAFDAPYALDARRCISYLTIEHRGPIPDELHAPIGDWLFGCDVCQDVCPWNRHAPPAREAALGPATPPPPPEILVRMTDDEFRARFRGSPLKRARREGLARNAAIVLANRRAARPRLV
jgi:epoxyqueuosine reductase